MNSNWPTTANHPPLVDGEAHVWAVPLDAAERQLDSLAAILSPDERQRAADFRLTAPRHRFLVSRGALRILLGRYLDVNPPHVAITVDSNNKPRLADLHGASELRFNVAHSLNLALIAVTSVGEIGVDVEHLRHVRHAEHIARRYFHPAEIAVVVAAPTAERDAAFLRCWTGKEAVLKAIGTGITGSLATFHVPIAEENECGITMDVAAPTSPALVQCWVRRLDPNDDYSAAVAVVGSRRNVRCMEFMS